MPLGAKVSLDPGDIVLYGDPAPPTERGTAAPPLFGPCLLWPNGCPSQQLLSSCDLTNSLVDVTAGSARAQFFLQWFHCHTGNFECNFTGGPSHLVDTVP